MVSMFVATSSGKWRFMNASPARSVGSYRADVSTAPRRETMRTRAPFQPVEHDPPVDALDDEFPLRLTTGRRLESFNTGVQSGRFSSPLHVGGEAILLAPEDGERYGVADGARVRVVSRRGAVEAPARYDTTLRPGLAFMNLHFPDEVATNVLTIDATDPKSGTAEFKATAVRLEAV